MKIRRTLYKTGRSLALTIPAPAVQELRLRAGQKLDVETVKAGQKTDVETAKDRIILEKVESKKVES